MREKFFRFMQGRYGNDQLNMFLLAVAGICSVISSFLVRGLRAGNILYFIGQVFILLFLARALSRNTSKRYNENQKFLFRISQFINWKNKKKSKIDGRKFYKYYKCPNCRQTVRVPKGKGKILITCPKCKTEFNKKT